MNESDNKNDNKNLSLDPKQMVEEYVNEHYDIHFNTVTELAEVREKGSDAPFLVADKRIMNSMLLAVRAQGIKCTLSDIKCLLCSDHIQDFHPMQTYMAELPEWDGVDRVSPLSQRISNSLVWQNAFHRWMLGLASQWMGRAEQCANSVAPILVSTRQGLGKSTFCRNLLPPALNDYYLDSMDITAKNHIEQRLGTMALINLDEFDRFNTAKMAWLKNIMQMKTCSYRKLYTNTFRILPRMASFIGTSNSPELLDDPSGSRRFICVEITEHIDRSPIRHDQLYAQLKAEILRGERTWLTADEEREVEEQNKAFYRSKPEEEVLLKCFRAPQEGDKAMELSVDEIYDYLHARNPKVMQGTTPKQMSRVLTGAGIYPRHTRLGNRYRLALVS